MEIMFVRLDSSLVSNSIMFDNSHAVLFSIENSKSVMPY